MQRATTPIQVTDEDRVASFGQAYGLRVTCRCGHVREVYRTLAGWKLGKAATIGELRERLRCTQCGAGRPRIGVFRRPRD